MVANKTSASLQLNKFFIHEPLTLQPGPSNGIPSTPATALAVSVVRENGE
jgi:hypothetical protein